MTTSKQIGERLRNRREQLRFTQGDVAEHLHMTDSNYSRIESGTVAISAESLSSLARFLRVPMSYFFDDHEEEAIEDSDAAAAYNGLPPQLKPSARAMLKALHDQAKAAETTHGRKAE